MLCYPPIYLIYNPQQPFSSTSLITLNISTKIQNLVFHRQQDPTFRSMTTRRGYEILGKESATTALLHEGFKRSTSLPSHGSNSSRKMALGSTYGDINQKRNPTKKGNDNNSDKKSHPLLSFLALRWKKKTTARPEFARYLEYLKEGGMWDLNSNKPVMYYK
ncbi:hypothetical protein GLYMA_16G135600v4 [Glycine max]|nr:uncharacterized protein LOC100793655 [Glycine max]KAG4380242.1 hypothetical protein GLYMA_16G135600v4 [Glycine max]|eukprot:XP_003548879.3 uncharacterized protein LOC100793655 [Glycine max]